MKTEVLLDAYKNVGSFVERRDCHLWKYCVKGEIKVLLKEVGSKSICLKYYLFYDYEITFILLRKVPTLRWKKITLKNETQRTSLILLLKRMLLGKDSFDVLQVLVTIVFIVQSQHGKFMLIISHTSF